MNDQTISNLITLGGVALGWLLSEATGWIKSKRRYRMLKKALEIEILDASHWLNRSRLILEQSIQYCVLGVVSTEAYPLIPTHVYDQHFTEASLKLTASERASFNGAYNTIKMINASYAKIEERVVQCQKNPQLKPQIELQPLLHSIYYNTRSAMFQIKVYLDNKKNFDMHNLSPELAKKFDAQIVDDVKRLSNEAIELGVHKIGEKLYQSQRS